MKSEQKVDIISYLPLELIEKISSHLDAKDITQVIKVSKWWKILFQNNVLCMQLCKVNQVLQMEEKYQSKACKRFIALFDCYYYYLWTYYLKLNQNWLEKPHSEVMRSVFQFSEYSDICYLDEQIIIFIFKERTLFLGIMQLKFEIYDSHRDIIDTFIVLANDYTDILRQGNLIVIGIAMKGNQKCTILVRDIESKSFLSGHHYINSVIMKGLLHVFKIAVNKDVIAATGLKKSEINIICLTTGNEKLKLQYNTEVLFFGFHNEELIVLTGDGNVHVVNFWEGHKKFTETTMQLNTIPNTFYRAVLEGQYLIAELNSNVYVCNITKNKLLYITQWPAFGNWSIKNSIAIYRKSMRVWEIVDYTNGNHIATIDLISDKQFQITANNRFLISACKEIEDPYYIIKIFDLFTGNFIRGFSLPRNVVNIYYFKSTETMLLIAFYTSTWEGIPTQQKLILDFDVYV